MNYLKYLWKTCKRIASDLWLNPVIFLSVALISRVVSNQPIELGFVLFAMAVAVFLFVVPLFAVGTIWFFKKKVL